MTYPPEPWHLGGELLVSVFLVDRDDLPAELPAGRRPITIAGRAIVGVAFAEYTPGGVLAYDELLVAVPSLGRGALRITIPQIWVNSPASLAGGRELWGIPKQPGEFTRVRQGSRVAVSLRDANGPVAAIRATHGLPLLPGMPRLALPILQVLGQRRILSRNSVVGRIRGLRASWTIDPTGPLAWLAGRRPLLNVAIRDASIIFGMDVQR